MMVVACTAMVGMYNARRYQSRAEIETQSGDIGHEFISSQLNSPKCVRVDVNRSKAVASAFLL